jgi:RNA-directed DNA polymerase
MWLEAAVVEASETKGGAPKISRSKQGTPQGGMISPLLVNLYLHWFDKVFHQADGPAHWAKAKLVRYADDFVVLARYVSPKLRGFIETKLESWMGLEINGEKTPVIDLKQKGASLDFLGFTFRYEPDHFGHGHQYLKVGPSKKALKREREKLHELTSGPACSMPIPVLIEKLNRHLKGWVNYFRYGYPRRVFDQINEHVQVCLRQNLRRRSQRPFRLPEGVTDYANFQCLGLKFL